MEVARGFHSWPMPPIALRASLAIALSLGPSLAVAQTRAPVVTEQPVDGSAIHRVQAETVIVAPFSAVVARVLDYEHYPEFMQRFRTARVVRRNRGATDVYFQLELPRAMGVVWFLHRMTVVSRTPERVEIAAYAWPGNVRELENAVERAVVLAREGLVEREHFSLPTAAAAPASRPPESVAPAPVGSQGPMPAVPGSTLADLERFAILSSLDACSGSTHRAAAMLDVSVRMIQYRLREYRHGIKRTPSPREDDVPPGH